MGKKLLIGVCLMLCGCGFQPIYGKHEVSNELKETFAATKISYNATRLNQAIASSLRNLINPERISCEQRYTLSFDAVASHSPLAIQIDQEITRYKVLVDVNYQLLDARTRQQLDAGVISRQGGYDVVESEYAVHVSRSDTERRVAKEVAEDIKLEMVSTLLKFATPKAKR